MTAISFAGVGQKYITVAGETLALRGIEFLVEEGELIGLVGPSGCGKSTILSLIAGLLLPTQGEVRVFAELVHSPSPDVGYMLQQDYLLPWRTIHDNILLGLEIQGKKTKANMEQALRLLHEMGLAHAADQHPHQLSGGMRQRVALVRTLTANPQVILLDEPFSALDYQIKLQLEELIQSTLKEKRLTGVLVTHDLGEAIAMCDRVFVMSKNPGTIKSVYPIPEEIRDLSPFAAREHPEFHALFRQVWRDLQDAD
ncbi:spermidine/putrescine ABC transporter ATP-binding protein [Tumebacillus algifaecis]|uniref:Spermidine/putrescine ABC transporter ATP-binding protein n=1 Tax=Tumebacillus algifaecis TaxID=1214604 RepID=A0A223D0P8_9BACL|nr:ABC transporter ATP-binding protein [Tumebacillus algifaecis]ASS74906.1 spermidine/putrescine ABC transporter ATP-binding protein [Tumebacillus algifaecis]